MVWWHWEAAGV